MSRIRKADDGVRERIWPAQVYESVDSRISVGSGDLFLWSASLGIFYDEPKMRAVVDDLGYRT